MFHDRWFAKRSHGFPIKSHPSAAWANASTAIDCRMNGKRTNRMQRPVTSKRFKIGSLVPRDVLTNGRNGWKADATLIV